MLHKLNCLYKIIIRDAPEHIFFSSGWIGLWPLEISQTNIIYGPYSLSGAGRNHAKCTGPLLQRSARSESGASLIMIFIKINGISWARLSLQLAKCDVQQVHDGLWELEHSTGLNFWPGPARRRLGPARFYICFLRPGPAR